MELRNTRYSGLWSFKGETLAFAASGSERRNWLAGNYVTTIPASRRSLRGLAPRLLIYYVYPWFPQIRGSERLRVEFHSIGNECVAESERR